MNKDKRMEQAARWFILRRDDEIGGKLQRLDWRRLWLRRAFRRWCRDEENVAAYIRIAAAHAVIERWERGEHAAEAVVSNVVPLFEEDRRRTSAPQRVMPSVEPAPAQAVMSRRRLAAALAGIAVGGIAGAALTKVIGSRREDVIASGHVLEVLLRDGVMHVARNSDYRLHPSSQAHIVHLLNGQAAFHLSPSMQSTTRVTAPLGDILAVAAEYAVLALDSLLVVTVVKGSVRVVSSLLSASEVVVNAGQKLTLRRGEVSSGSIVQVDARRELGWMQGDFHFDGESFGEAASSFNRFNETQIILSPAIARLTVPTHQCALTDPERFIERFAGDFNLEIRRDGKLIRVFERDIGPTAR
ncbi:hypothetical protein GCM10011487_56880 [Steroidobacter agaridevorans]|uniref:FecR protein domain-containing protein n=1 Tax=Steroidobacter agaridevorans TaxID=2695856 RepID=A0A829YLV4_9GAMM|nr:FecR domain-containing protein [Steroidobacter agaridevorans]GFE83688.1 hypothetical protein GCM10011487_56880 [Steroidobacter agaridevorans]